MKPNRKKRFRKNNFNSYAALEPRNLLALLVVTTGIDNGLNETDGEVSLREAIIAANTDQPYLDAPAGNGLDKIIFDSSLEGETISLIRGEVLIESEITIEGPAEIDAFDRGRHFRIETPHQVNLNLLEFVNGEETRGGSILIAGMGNVSMNETSFINNESTAGPGGAIYLSGGGRLGMANGIVAGNEANNSENSNAVGNGGAIHVAGGSFIASNMAFVNNEAQQNGGAVNVASGFTAFYESRFDGFGAEAQSGAFISLSENATSRIVGTTFENGTAEIAGGAIANFGGELFVTSSSFIDNEATLRTPGSFRSKGGAIFSTGRLVIGANAVNPLSGSNFANTTNEFRLNTANSGGAIFHSNDSIVFVREIDQIANFVDNRANLGGAIRLYRSTARINEAVFTQNIAELSGGAIFSTETDLDVRNPRFTENYAGRSISSGPLSVQVAGGMGGAIAANESTLNILADGLDSYFNSQEVSSRGGAIALNRSDLFVRDVEFSDNRIFKGSELIGETATASGGAIDAVNSDIRLSQVSFSQNRSIDQISETRLGGALSLLNSTADIAGSFFFGNSSSTGGAISARVGTDLTLRANTFSSNSAILSGGALDVDERSTATIVRSNFGGDANRVSRGVGGAIANAGRLSINSSVFTLNVADEPDQPDGLVAAGGAIYNSGDATIDATTFSENSASNGGAIHSVGRLRVFNTVFQANRVLSFTSAEGGALYSAGETQLSSTVFVSNLAEAGGALAVTSGKLIARNITFGGERESDGNIAIERSSRPTAGRGGAVWVAGDAEVVFGRTTFENNTARRHGGAIAIDSESGDAKVLIFDHSLFSNNSTVVVANPSVEIQTDGGAIFVGDGELDIRNSELSQNSSFGNGGGIYLDENAVATIRSTELRSNSAALIGGAILNRGTLRLVDSLAVENTAEEFGAIADIDMGVSTILRSEFRDNLP